MLPQPRHDCKLDRYRDTSGRSYQQQVYWCSRSSRSQQIDHHFWLAHVKVQRNDLGRNCWSSGRSWSSAIEISSIIGFVVRGRPAHTCIWDGRQQSSHVVPHQLPSDIVINRLFMFSLFRHCTLFFLCLVFYYTVASSTYVLGQTDGT